MATREELEQRVTSLRQRVAALENELTQATQRQRDLERSQSELNQRIAAAIENKNQALADQLKAERDQIRNERRNVEARIEQLDSEISDARSQLYQAEQALSALARQPVQSTGTTVQQAQTARDDGANTQNPEPPPAVTASGGVGDTAEVEPRRTVTTPSNAVTNEPPPPAGGTNDRLRTLEETQQAQPPTAQPGAALSPNNAAANNSGQAVPTDDAAATGTAPGGSTAATPATANTNTNTGASAAQVASGATARNVQPTSTPGVGSAGDDQLNATRTQINAYFGGPTRAIVPQDNILDRYASYSYNISIYIMSPEDYRRLLTSKKKNISGLQLLMSSAGAPGQVAGTVSTVTDPASGTITTTGGSVPGRNQFFPLDFYIDDVRLKSVISGKGTAGPHNVFDMTFKVVEPNGITFLDNLYAATQDYVARNGGIKTQNYASQNYLMVIRFYGYDAEGRPVSLTGAVRNADGSVGAETIVEKFIPFQFTSIKFRVANRLTEYECQAAVPQSLINIGQGRGTIPYNVEVTATTLKELLTGTQSFRDRDSSNTTATTGANSGNASDTGEVPGVTVTAGSSATQNQAPPKASAAPKPTLTGGLCDALNRYQQDRVKRGYQLVADEYVIDIVDQVLQDASTQPPNLPGSPTNWSSTAMVQSQDAADRKDGRKQNANNTSKSVSIVAGTNIVRFMDQVIRNSTFVYDQQTKMPTVDKNGKRIDIPQGQPADALAWYRIGVEAEPLKYDVKRQDYAYRIKYQITMYKVNGVKSEYFPTSPFQGTHKVYNYWFTGQNTSILNLEQDYNYLYYITVNGPRGYPNVTSDYREIEKYTYQTRSNQSDQGQRRSVINEPGANAADYLYSPADQSRIKMTIIGDPAWLQQGEIWAGLQGQQVYSQGTFLPDGTINFENQEVLFEVAFNKPVDYDSSTGVMDPGRKNYGINRAAGEAGSPRQSFVYKAVTVESVFSQGRFTQELEGVLIMFPKRPTEQKLTEEDRQNADNPPDSLGRTATNSASEAAQTIPTQSGTPAAPPGSPNESTADVGTAGSPSATDTDTDTTPAPATANETPTSGTTTVAGTPPVTPKVTSLPPGVNLDPASGAYLYTDVTGEQNRLVAGTNEALARQVQALNTGNTVTYVDYDRNSGWVNKSYDPQTQQYRIIGPAADPNAQNVTTQGNAQLIARDP